MGPASKHVYESEALRVDGRYPPVVLFEFRSPPTLSDEEVQMILAIGDERIEAGDPYVSIAVPRLGSGLLRPRHRKVFSDWLFARERELGRENLSSVVVIPDRMLRALMRIIYRFRAPTIRTVTVSDLEEAANAARQELARMGQPSSAGIEAFLTALANRNQEWSTTTVSRSSSAAGRR